MLLVTSCYCNWDLSSGLMGHCTFYHTGLSSVIFQQKLYGQTYKCHVDRQLKEFIFHKNLNESAEKLFIPNVL